MTQLFSSASNQPSPLPNEKRAFSGLAISSNRQVNGSNSQVSQKIKNFFRINSFTSNDSKEARAQGDGGPPTGRGDSGSKLNFRQSRFIPHLSRNRTNTTASEGNPLDDSVSPTANANPYFAHQGMPALRHHNENSVPPSPPDTPPVRPVESIVAGAAGEATAEATTAGKEELARKLRRVASAPNAQGLFAGAKSNERPKTAELGKEPLVQHGNSSSLSMVEASNDGHLLQVATNGDGVPSPGQIRNAVAFRRTYSSNSIKVRNVEVGPSSFDKIKLIGKGDVGKVYLVREKKSSRLYAMKGAYRKLQHMDCRGFLTSAQY